VDGLTWAVEPVFLYPTGSDRHGGRHGALGRWGWCSSNPAPGCMARWPTISGPSAARRMAEGLQRVGGNRAEAARLLGIPRTTLWTRMRELGLAGT
jgi:hypothetical protein